MKVNLKKGISLTEVAVSLLVIGLVLLMVISYFQSVAETKRMFDLKQDVENASQKVIDFTMLNGRLPEQADFDDFVTFRPTHTITYTFDAQLIDPSFNRVHSVCSLQDNNTAEAFTVSGRAPRIRQADIDNMTRIISLNELKGAINCDVSNTVLLITTQSLPRAVVPNAYRAEIHAIGGRPGYAWCAEIDKDVAGIISANSSLFRNCAAPASWNKMDLAQITLSAFPKNLQAQIRIITIYVSDENGNITTRRLPLYIDNY